MMFGQYIISLRVFKWLATALISLHECAGWSEALLVTHTTLLEISRLGSFVLCVSKKRSQWDISFIEHPEHTFWKEIIKIVNKYAPIAGPHSAVGNVSGYRCVSDCRSRGREFDPGPAPYFRGDWSWNDFYGHSPPSADSFKKGCCQLQVKVCARITG